MKYTIDRFENAFAVVELESGKFVDVLRETIPQGAKEGDIISIEIDKQATAKKKKDIDDAMKDMWTD